MGVGNNANLFFLGESIMCDNPNDEVPNDDEIDDIINGDTVEYREN